MKNIIRLVAVTLMGFAGLMIANAEGTNTNLGPAVGSVIALDFAALDQNGEQQNFESVAGEKGAVVVFFRSAKWCPFCQMQLIDLNTNAQAEVEKRGYNIIGVSYDKPEDLARFTKKWKLNYTLLSDDGSKMIDALGIRNEEYKEGHYASGVPHPIILVLDSDKKVLAKLSREGYRDRPEPQVLIETLDKL